VVELKINNFLKINYVGQSSAIEQVFKGTMLLKLWWISKATDGYTKVRASILQKEFSVVFPSIIIPSEFSKYRKLLWSGTFFRPLNMLGHTIL